MKEDDLKVLKSSLGEEEKVRVLLRQIFSEEQILVLRNLIERMFPFPLPKEKRDDEVALLTLLLHPEWRGRWRFLAPESLEEEEILVFALLLGLLMFFYLERTPQMGTILGQIITFKVAVADYGVDRSLLEGLIRDGIELMERQIGYPLWLQHPKA